MHQCEVHLGQERRRKLSGLRQLCHYFTALARCASGEKGYGASADHRNADLKLRASLKPQE